MNKRELERIRKKNMEKLDSNKMYHRFGCVRVNCNNSLKHEIAKLKEVYYALKEGHIVATECVSKDNKRKFDFVDFDNGIIKEIETGKSYKKDGENVITVRLK